jgi:guanylate kinase
MSSETLEQMKARLKREDEEKEEAFQKRLEEIREPSGSSSRAGSKGAGRAERAR